MKSTALTLALALTAVSAAPAAAQQAELFPTPILTPDTLVGLDAVHTNAVSLFAQTSVSVGSVAIASILPSAGPSNLGQETQRGVLAFDAYGDPLYLQSGVNLGEEKCFDNCLPAFDDAGFVIGVYSTNDLASPIGSGSLNDVEALTNLAASALNSLTFTSTGLTLTAIPTPPLSTQLAIADGTTSTANLNVPNVTGGMKTMSNTALGAVNTISVDLSQIAPQL